ncbi:MAG: PQQ-binding-like beta-propeller repeat protein [Gemmataceae bacterium]
MRPLTCLVLLLTLGCARPPVETPVAAEAPPAAADDALPPDLRTRKTGDDWPCFLGPTHDSVSREKGILTPWPAGGPRIVWERAIDVGYAMPSISRGRLFLFDRTRNRCTLRCWKAETAEPLWTFDYPTDYRDMYGYNGGPRCCPVVDGDRVYVYGPEGMLHCVRVVDGKPLWKVDTRTTFNVVQNFFGVGSTPVVEGDLLLVQVGGSPRGSDLDSFMDLKGDGSGLVAFDKRTGQVRYKVSDELASYSSPVVATVGKRRYCFLFARGGLLALEPATGKIDFHFPWRANMLESVNAGNPVIVGDRVLVSECYQLGTAVLAVRPGGFTEVWTDRERGGRTKALLCHWMTPVCVNGHVYASSGRHKGEAELRCVELATGKVRWREPDLTRASLLHVDGHFVLLGEDGWLRLVKVNPERYEEVSRVLLRRTGRAGKPDADGEPLLEEPCWAAPIVSNGLLYVRGDRRLVCLELIPAKR